MDVEQLKSHPAVKQIIGLGKSSDVRKQFC